MKSNFVTRFLRVLCIAVFAIAVAGGSAWAQTQGAAPAKQVEEVFVSVDTVLVGCAAGGFSAAAAALLPLMTSYAAGGPTTYQGDLMLGWAGLGCAVGIWAGLIAIGTAIVLDAL